MLDFDNSDTRGDLVSIICIVTVYDLGVKIRYVLRNGIHGHVKIGKSNPEALYSISGVALASEECHLVLPRHDQQMVENPAPNIPS